MAGNTYILSSTSSIDLSWSLQPDYGLGLVPTYSVEIAKPAESYTDTDGWLSKAPIPRPP